MTSSALTVLSFRKMFSFASGGTNSTATPHLDSTVLMPIFTTILLLDLLAIILRAHKEVIQAVQDLKGHRDTQGVLEPKDPEDPTQEVLDRKDLATLVLVLKGHLMATRVVPDLHLRDTLVQDPVRLTPAALARDRLPPIRELVQATQALDRILEAPDLKDPQQPTPEIPEHVARHIQVAQNQVTPVQVQVPTQDQIPRATQVEVVATRQEDQMVLVFLLVQVEDHNSLTENTSRLETEQDVNPQSNKISILNTNREFYGPVSFYETCC